MPWLKRKEYLLQASVQVPLRRERVFEFFADAFRLELLTPEWLSFRVLTEPPIEMRRGALIDYRLRLHGIPVRWRTEITEWEPPFQFEDSQLRGPYYYWHHTHTFLERDGGTLVEDAVRYSAPGGAALHGLFIRRELRKIFEYRQQQLPRLLGAAVSECEASPVTIIPRPAE